MPPSRSLHRRALALLLALLTISTVLSACGGPDQDTEDTTMDLTTVEAAVTSAAPRVVGFGPTKRVTNGMGHALLVGLRTEGTEPLSADELDSVARAIWTSVPWEPNALRLTARDAATGEVPVDLRAGAAALPGLVAGPFGDEGVAITGLTERYGAWHEPE